MLREMLKEAKAGRERANKKRLEFMESLKGLNLREETIKEIEKLMDSMEAANMLGESDLATAFKDEIKKTILRDRGYLNN